MVLDEYVRYYIDHRPHGHSPSNRRTRPEYSRAVSMPVEWNDDRILSGLINEYAQAA